MAQNERETLCALEHLMEEFFNSNTSNARKHEIELQLEAFNNQRDSWKLCIYFLNHTSSQFVSMYALSTIESVINRQWVSLQWEHRTQLKTALHYYLVRNNAGCPNFLRNKLAKLLVDIARHDWPYFYPEYISIILQFLQSEQEQVLGLVLLRTTSEEIMSTRVEMSSSRKEELHILLNQHVPQIFQLLTNILDTLGTKPRHTVTATPPPSPTHPSSLPEPAPQLSTASFRPDAKEVAREALSTAQHLFSWVDLTLVTPQLIRSIFHFTNASSYAQDDDMCVLAISTINEILYRKCAPPGSQNLFIQLYHYAVQLLRDITCSASGRIESLAPDFVDKLTEFLCLLVSQHLWRLEADNHFSAIEFLSLLFQCTFQQATVDSLLSCLDVWRAFMKQLKRENTFKYVDALIGLTKEVLNKMQFRHNHDQLQDLDNETIDDDNETEWQHFVKECIEIIAMVGETMPKDVFNLVWMPWQAANEMYLMTEKVVSNQNVLNIDYNESERLHGVLRDLSTLTQSLARLSTFFTERDTQISSETNTYVDTLIMELLKSALYASRVRYDRVQVPDSKLTTDFIEVHAQVLAGLKTWCVWFVMNKRDHNSQIGELVTITSSILLNGDQEPAKLSLSAAHLFLCVTNITFPPNLITIPPIIELIRTSSMMRYQDEHTLNVLYQALCNILLQSWGDLNESDKNQRMLLIKMFFDSLTKNFREISPSTNEAQVRQIVTTTLPCVSQIIENCKHFSSASKKLLHVALQSTIEHALSLFPRYADSPDISGVILELFLVVLEGLQQQLGLHFTKMAVEVFLEVAINDQRSQKLSGLDKLLQILQLVVEGPGQIYRNFLPGIISLCMDHVYPSVGPHADQHPDIISALLTLLHSIMHHRWQYFYTSQVRLGYSPGASDCTGACELESIHHQEELLAILRAFGQALLQADLNVFRLSLASLENLNSKWKLYHKMLFKEHLLSQFLTVLLQNLLHKSHALLNDDIMCAVYNMSAVDFNAFFSTFLPHFLQTIDGLDQQQKETLQGNFLHDTDMPTFVQNVHRFINDMRCYRICNNSLPSGSVIL